jgi:hypothetical protein
MSINSLSCIQSIIANKTIVPSGPPPIIQTMSNVYTQNPFLYWSGDSGQITTNSKGIVMGFRTTISNQISPYTFKNGYYYVTTSDTISGTNALGGDLYTTFCGNINNVPDTPWQSPTVYTTSEQYVPERKPILTLKGPLPIAPQNPKTPLESIMRLSLNNNKNGETSSRFNILSKTTWSGYRKVV